MAERCINIVENLGGSLISRIFHYVFRHPALLVTITHTESRRFWQYSKQCSLFESGEYQLDFFCGQIHAGQLTLSVNINPSSPIYLLISWNPITRRLSHSVFHDSSSFRTAAVHLRLRFPADNDRP